MTHHDPIQALLEATGRRPPVAEWRTGRVRSAVRAAWEAEVAAGVRQRRFTWMLTAAASVAAISIAGWSLRSFVATGPGAASGVRVESAGGDASIRHGSLPFLRSTDPMRPGADVPVGAWLVTGPGTRAAVRAGSGHSVRLDHGTTLRVDSDRAFRLAAGAIYAQSPDPTTPSSGGLRIETPFGVIEDTGTQFEARLSDRALLVRVREGQVTFSGSVGPAVVAAGQALEVDRTGRVRRFEEETPSGVWTWAEGIASPMSIEGRSLREFLDWATRERGARLQFSDARLAGRASEVVLRGSIDGMSLDQAVSSVLRASGLTSRWEGNVLVVSDQGDPHAAR